MLIEVLGFSDLKLEEKEELRNLFEQELISFIDQLTPVMAWIVNWRRGGQRACLNDICMHHLFRITEGRLSVVNKPKNCGDVSEYIHKQCNLDLDESFNLTEGISEFSDGGKHEIFTRGKYLLWFLVEFCLSVYRDCLEISVIKSILKKPKNTTNFSQSCAIVLISSRFRIPESLQTFLNSTVKSYVMQQNAA